MSNHPKDDRVLRKELARRLTLSRGKNDLKAQKNRARAYDLGLIGTPCALPDTREYGKDDVVSAQGRMRSMADKLARGIKLDGADKYQGGPSGPITDPLWRKDQPSVAARRPSSPFKKVKVTPIIIRT
jgi:hypothetical protein